MADKSEVETDDAHSQNEGHTPEVSEAEDGGNGARAGMQSANKRIGAFRF